MKQHYINLFNYNNWANERCFLSLIVKDNETDKPLILFSHIIAAQNIWLNRVLGKESNPFSPWIEFPFKELLINSQNSTQNWLGFLNDLDEDSLEIKTAYQNSKGEKFINKTSEIITHVINHSTYHRGQIASFVRKAGGIPAVTDYIAYLRE